MVGTAGQPQNSKLRILLGILATLCVAACFILAMRISSAMGFDYPSRGKISALETEIDALKVKRDELAEKGIKHAQNQDRLKALSQGFWRPEGKPEVLTRITRKVSRLAKDDGLRLSTIGQPIEIATNDHFTEVVVFVKTSNTSIKTLGKFIRDVDAHMPALEWKDCTIHPTPPRQPTHIVMTGKIRAYVLTNDAVAILEGRPLPEKEKSKRKKSKKR